MALIGSSGCFGAEKFSRTKRCSECGEGIPANTECLVSRDRQGKNKKIVCSDECRRCFDDRFWQELADKRERASK